MIVTSAIPPCSLSRIMVPLPHKLTVKTGSLYATTSGDMQPELFRGDAFTIQGLCVSPRSLPSRDSCTRAPSSTPCGRIGPTTCGVVTSLLSGVVYRVSTAVTMPSGTTNYAASKAIATGVALYLLVFVMPCFVVVSVGVVVVVVFLMVASSVFVRARWHLYGCCHRAPPAGCAYASLHTRVHRRQAAARSPLRWERRYRHRGVQVRYAWAALLFPPFGTAVACTATAAALWCCYIFPCCAIHPHHCCLTTVVCAWAGCTARVRQLWAATVVPSADFKFKSRFPESQ